MLIQAALNGLRVPGAHPALPVTPEQMAAEARAAVAAGAGALHVHVRDGAGRECLDPADVQRTILALRAACPGVPLGVSTGAWIVPDVQRRLALLERWETLPDYASVNFDEEGALEVVDLLQRKGVAVEAGLANPDAAEVFVRSGRVAACLRVLLEPGEQTAAAARANVAALERMLDAAGIRLPRLLHGADRTAWPILQDAVARGVDTRIGFEDTLALPDGTAAPGNAALVAAVWALAKNAVEGALGTADAPAMRAFLDVAAALNHGFGVAPILYGSLGLGRAVPLAEPAGDVDILVPEELLSQRWPELVAALAEIGCALVDLREHEFRRGGRSIAFAAEESLVPFAGVDPAQLPATTVDGVGFRELSPEQYLAVYGASQHDGYRRDTRGKRDADKIAQIRRWLAARER